MSENTDLNVSLICTAITLHVVDANFTEEESRVFLLELAQKNPRVFEILCSANTLHSHCLNGKKLF